MKKMNEQRIEVHIERARYEQRRRKIYVMNIIRKVSILTMVRATPRRKNFRKTEIPK